MGRSSGHMVLGRLTGSVLADALILLALGVPLFVIFLVYMLQRRLIYLPQFPAGSRTDVWRPDRFDIAVYEDVYVTTADGVRLHCLWVPADPESLLTAPIVVHFHGNAGNIGHRLPITANLRAACKGAMSTLLVSYRGYGLSGGSPSQPGFLIDAETALIYVRQRPDTGACPIVVFGQSIGGAVALDTVARFSDRVDALVIENTFLSLPALVPIVAPALRHFAFMLCDKWMSIDRAREIAEYNRQIASAAPSDTDTDESSLVRHRSATHGAAAPVKVLLLAGRRDELIPHTHMQSLFKELGEGSEAFTRHPHTVQMVVFPGGDHNATFIQPGYFDHFASFLSSLRVRRSL